MKVGVSQNFSMGWPLVKSLLWALLLFVQIHEHRACIEEERMSLLELKAFIKSHTNYTEDILPTWVYETKSDCCSWERVNCSTTTGHMINLTLSDINRVESWFLNMSLLQPFKELRILDLSFNGIAGWPGNEGTWAFAFTIIRPTPKTHTHSFMLNIGKALDHCN